MENHIDSFKEHSYVETFKGLKLRYDQEQDKAKSIAERFLFRLFFTIYIYTIVVLFFDVVSQKFDVTSYIQNRLSDVQFWICFICSICFRFTIQTKTKYRVIISF